jgi:hypothetical protein
MREHACAELIITTFRWTPIWFADRVEHKYFSNIFVFLAHRVAIEINPSYLK